ncbi:mannitol dehydrogenase family protein [Leifsonia sp. NPDC058248]|uniref:mannitol dehydrogenase family protein n=1 Tax=Leifsonia sp. NPDC058248 TaxID=3346402 RepID=UPI0036D7C363
MTPPARTERHPVRIVHLGLGAFHRAHQAWYTQRANDASSDGASGDGGWGIAAFTGRSPRAAEALAAQDAVYTLVERGPESDTATLIQSLTVVADGADGERWRAAMADPAVAVVTLTVTEAGYRPDAAALDADLAALRAGGAAATAPGRLVDGLRARRAAGSPRLAIVSCDNLPDNGAVTREAVLGLAARVDQDLAAWIDGEISFVSTMVDRITPATTDADRATVEQLTGFDDAAPVVTEPFSEWVLSGEFPAGRPAWDAVGAQFVSDVEPFERRKLWLLNAGHSLLAYLGLLRGHTTIAEAMADPACADALEALWSEARTELPFDEEAVDAALAALRDRFTNARIEHRLAQIATDGSQKLGPRILDPLRSRLDAGRAPGVAQAGAIAAWIRHLLGGAYRDPGAEALAARLGELSDDEDLATEAMRALAPGVTGLEPVIALIRDQLGALRATTTILTTEPQRGAH